MWRRDKSGHIIMHQMLCIMCMSRSSLGKCTIYSTWSVMIFLVIPILSLLLLYNPYILSLNCNSLVSFPFLAAFSNILLS